MTIARAYDPKRKRKRTRIAIGTVREVGAFMLGRSIGRRAGFSRMPSDGLLSTIAP